MSERRLYLLLLIISFAIAFGFHGWNTLINNYAFAAFNFTGKDIGLLQSVREIPGLLAFTVIIPLLLLSEMHICLLSLFLLGLGITFSSYFDTASGLYFGTILMSVGFHYAVTLKQSLALQHSTQANTGFVLGKMVAFGSIGSLFAYVTIFLLNSLFQLDEKFIFYFLGIIVMILSVLAWLFSRKVLIKDNFQRKRLFLKKEYWLFYLLNFFAGARRQIFVVFGGFLMIEKFHYSVAAISLLFFCNQIFNYFFAPYIGRLIHFFGEKAVLTLEYTGLIIVFILYAHVDNFYFAGALYIIDNLFFLMALSINSYFKKIAKKEDIAASMSVSFTINHIMAVFIPVVYGYLWINLSYQIVFYSAAFFAFCSLVSCQYINIAKQEIHHSI